MNIRFERATPNDAEALVKAEVAAFHHDTVLYSVPLGGPPGYDSVENALQKMAEHDCYCIVYEGEIVGGIVVMNFGEGHFHLDLLYIDPEYHNRGIGTQAMEFITENYTASIWTLDTPIWAVRNRHFYEKFGFVNVKETEYEDITLITYQKLT